jgi:hypothetical protein
LRLNQALYAEYRHYMFTRNDIKMHLETILSSGASESEKASKVSAMKLLAQWAKNKGYISDRDIMELFDTKDSDSAYSAKGFDPPINGLSERANSNNDPKLNELNRIETSSSSNRETSNLTQINVARWNSLHISSGEIGKIISKYGMFVIGIPVILIILTGIIFTVLFIRNPSSPHNEIAYSDSAKTTSGSLRFEGSLVGKNGDPIDRKVDVRFSLYASPRGTTPLYTGTCYGQNGIVPNFDGTFSVSIGADCGMEGIPTSVLRDYPTLHLGIAVGKGKEMTPRYPISTVPLASNAQAVQGISVGNTESTIPYIDQEGALTLGALSPVIKSTRGDFAIEGRTLTLRTTEGSEGSIYLQPDPGGFVSVPSGKLGIGTDTPVADLDIDGSMRLTGDILLEGSGTGIYQVDGGALTVYSSRFDSDDVFPTFTVASSGNVGIGVEDPKQKLEVLGDMGVSGTLVFKGGPGTIAVENGRDMFLGGTKTGNIYLTPGGKLGLGTTHLLDTVTVGGGISPAESERYSLGSATSKWATVYTNALVLGEEGIGGFWQRKGGTLQPVSSTDDIIVGSLTGSSSKIRLSGDTGETSWIANGAFGLGTTSPRHLFTASGSAGNSSTVSLSNLTTGDNRSTGVLRLNLGTATTGNASNFVQFFAGSTSEDSGRRVGSIRLQNGGVVYETSGADFAEYMEVTEEALPGDIIAITGTGTKRAFSGDHPVGVVSDVAGFVGNANADIDPASRALVGVLGRIGTNVSTLNGVPRTGSQLTAGPIRGYGIVLHTAGTSVGTVTASEREISDSLRNEHCPVEARSLRDPEGNPVRCGRIPVFVSAGHYEPPAQIARVRVTEETLAPTGTYERMISDLRTLLSSTTQRLGTIIVRSLEAADARIERLVADSVKSPLVETELLQAERVRTERIESKDGTVTIDLGSEENGTPGEGLAALMIRGLDGKEIATVDAAGNATFSGTLSARSVETDSVRTESIEAQTATIAGTIVAGEVDAGNIRDLRSDVDSLRDELESGRVEDAVLRETDAERERKLTEVRKLVDDLTRSTTPDPSFYQKLTDESVPEGSSSAEAFEQLTVTGNANTYDLSVSNSLSTGSILVKGDTIVSLARELRLSSLATIDLINGAVRVDNDGTLTSRGAVVANGGVRTPKIAPIEEGGTLAVELGSGTGNEGSLEIRNGDETTAAIDAEGNAVFASLTLKGESSGSARTLSAEEHRERYGIPTPALETGSGAAGTGVVPSGSGALIVYHEGIGENTLVYLTPVSSSPVSLSLGDTKVCSPEDADSGCRSYFTVIADPSDSQDVKFNWLVIN